MASDSDAGVSANTYTTPAFDYTVCRLAREHKRPQPCALVAAAVHDSVLDTLVFPCFYCDQSYFNQEEYMRHHAQRLTNSLRSRFPGMPRESAEDVGLTFESILREANAAHRFSCHEGAEFTTVHCVLIYIHYRRQMSGEEEASRQSFDEAAGPRPKPASFDSVLNLLAAQDQCDPDVSGSEDDCVICLDPIRTRRSTLRMECSHVFHKECLLQWLKTNHVCPLCRYEMPTEHQNDKN